jgi:hypothetical protein
MRKLIVPLLAAGVAFAGVGCDGQKVTGSTAPLSDEEKRQIAEQDKRIEDEESPGNKTLKGKKK